MNSNLAIPKVKVNRVVSANRPIRKKIMNKNHSQALSIAKQEF